MYDFFLIRMNWEFFCPYSLCLAQAASCLDRNNAYIRQVDAIAGWSWLQVLEQLIRTSC